MRTLTLVHEKQGTSGTQSYFDKPYGSGFLLIAYRDRHYQGWYKAKIWVNNELVDSWKCEDGLWTNNTSGVQLRHLRSVVKYHGKRMKQYKTH